MASPSEKNGDDKSREIDTSMNSDLFQPPDFLIPDLALHPVSNLEFLDEQRAIARDLFNAGCDCYQKGTCPEALQFFEQALSIFNELYDQLKDCRDADCHAMIKRKIAFVWYKLGAQLYNTLVSNQHDLNQEEQNTLYQDIENALSNAMSTISSLPTKTKKDYETLAFFHSKTALFNLSRDLPKAIRNFKRGLDYLTRIEDGSCQQTLLQTAGQLIRIYDQEAQKAFVEKNFAKAMILCKQAICTYKHYYKPYADGDADQRRSIREVSKIEMLFAECLVAMAHGCASDQHLQEAVHKLKEATAVLKEQLNSVLTLTKKDKRHITLQLVNILANLAKIYASQKDMDNAIVCYQEALMRLNDSLLKKTQKGLCKDLNLELAAALLCKQNGKSVVSVFTTVSDEQTAEATSPRPKFS